MSPARVDPVELAGGIDRLPLVHEALATANRPPDVLRAVARHDALWKPVYDATRAGNDAQLGAALHQVLTRYPTDMTAEPAELARMWKAIPHALEGTDPRFVVNRTYGAVMRHLNEQRPIMTDTAGGATNDRWLARRLNQETRLDYHGDGDDAGKSVYVSLQFGDEMGVLPYYDNLDPPEPNAGAWQFGSYSMELDRDVAPRTTVARADSPLLRGADELGGVEQLRSVVMERLARDTMLTDRLAQADNPTHDKLLNAYIRSEAFSRLDVNSASFFEGQVRGGVDMDKVRKITIDKHQWTNDSFTPDRVEVVRNAARKLGIPVVFDSRPWDEGGPRNTHKNDWWTLLDGNLKDGATPPSDER